MEIDHFSTERRVLNEVLEHLGDPTTVTLHELAMENVFGDPGLRPAMLLVQQAGEAAAIAATLVRLALNAIPAPVEVVDG
jgi:hypothetical protein